MPAKVQKPGQFGEVPKTAAQAVRGESAMEGPEPEPTVSVGAECPNSCRRSRSHPNHRSLSSRWVWLTSRFDFKFDKHDQRVHKIRVFGGAQNQRRFEAKSGSEIQAAPAEVVPEIDE